MRIVGINKYRAFSLIELVIAIVIISLIGSIAIPAMSRGAAGATDAALIENLSILRGALDMYQAENGGAYPSAANMPNALLKYNDGAGRVSLSKGGTFIYGPYLTRIPPLPVGAAKGAIGIATPRNLAAQFSTTGWVYEPASGEIAANTTTREMDANGIAYSRY